MPRNQPALLEPRKAPVQARSTASVEAILEATVQVLLQVGRDRLTTTKVADRAGVSVGTLYQYFPNKSALLKAALRRHLEEITTVIENVCGAHHGEGLDEMATAVITAFFDAKMRDAGTSVALYSISSDLDGVEISREMSVRSHEAIRTMLETSREPLLTDPHLVTTILQGILAGVSRRLLESGEPERHVQAQCREVVVLARAYLNECA